uniref:Phospholipase A1 n=1 Tax=uncultured bacterium pFosPlaG TaxID=491370 RepID=B0FB14_9BACT|nr:phospholipase A1 [uncultured bacterium pFosPlaG]
MNTTLEKPMKINLIVLISLFIASSAFAGFDWGGASCSGSGTFQQAIARNDVVVVGDIPVGKQEVLIELRSDQDVDIQLFDKNTGLKIVQWPDGILNGPSKGTTLHGGFVIEYSGYNGDGTGSGHEYIKIYGTVDEPLTMKAFGYAAGTATVEYSWEGTENCTEGPARSGSGTFQQDITQNAVVEVGELPAGLTNVNIDLISDRDVDIQLFDKNNGTKIVQWPNGILNGAGKVTTTYGSVTIEYSGYNGDGTGSGHEYIRIMGKLDRPLIMKAFGYASGYATINYSWGLNQSDYEKAIDYGKLSAQAYDWDDYAAAHVGMGFFANIDDIKATDFATPNYVEVQSVGGYIDWWGTDGLDFKVFQNTETDDLVVAYKGTEPLSPVDWVADAEQIFGNSEQYQKAVDFARDLSAQVEQYNVQNGLTGDAAMQLSFTGHSLGGGLATASALATGREAMAFDAAGLSQGTINNLGLDIRHASKITNFNVKGDWLSDHNKQMDDTTLGSELAGIVPETKQYGNTYWLEGINDIADFGGWLVPDNNMAVDFAKSILNHAWHVYVYMLENDKFL